MAPGGVPGPERWNWTLGVQFAPIPFSLDTPLSRIRPQMPSSLYSQPEGHRLFIWRRPLLHHSRRHWPNDTNSPCWFCFSFQPRNPYRAVSKDDLSPESSNFQVVPSHLRSIPFHQSTLPVIHVLQEGKPDHFLSLCSVRILFRPVGRWAHSGFSIHLLHWWKTHHTVRF